MLESSRSGRPDNATAASPRLSAVAVAPLPRWVPAAAAVIVFAAVDLLLMLLMPHPGNAVFITLAAALVALATLPAVFRLADYHQENLERHRRHIDTLHALDTAIAAEMELGSVLQVAAREATRAVDGEQGGVVLLRRDGGVEAEAFFNTPDAGKDFLRKILVEGTPVRNLEIARVPVMSGTARYGYLGVIKHLPSTAFPPERRALLSDLSTTVMIAVKNARALDEARRLSELKTMLMEALNASQIEILERLAQAAEFRDDATGDHTRRVGRIAHLLSWAVGLSDEEGELLKRAAPLHDVGKIGISDSILMKPSTLTEDEFDAMKYHTTLGAKLLSDGHSELVQTASRIALTHHERWDGCGYPRGLCRDEIPIEGRIVAVADVFDALTHARPYKAAWSVDDAVEEIVSQSGLRFDPQVVDAFLLLPHHDLL